MVTSLVLMMGAVLFALESYWLLPTAPWQSVLGFALSAVLSVGGVCVHKQEQAGRGVARPRAIHLVALTHVLVAIGAAASANAEFPKWTWIMPAACGVLRRARRPDLRGSPQSRRLEVSRTKASVMLERSGAHS
jgi:hypothetical protein